MFNQLFLTTSCLLYVAWSDCADYTKKQDCFEGVVGMSEEAERCCWTDDNLCIGSIELCETTTSSPVISTTSETTTLETTTEVTCDSTDLNEWRPDYIGKSTQFRIYEACGKKFIKFKMEDLTEYSADGKKEKNKETAFASAKDWEWGPNSSQVLPYGDSEALYNKFIADTLTKVDAIFELETRFFFKEVTIQDDQGNNITYPVNTLKFDVNITNWIMEEPDDYLVLCIGIMTNKAGDIDDDPDTKTFYLDGFEIDNIQTAQCINPNGTVTDINVDIERDGNGNNHLDLCYTFDSCDGDIQYDPIVLTGGDWYINSGDSNDVNSLNVIFACFAAGFIALFI